MKVAVLVLAVAALVAFAPDAAHATTPIGPFCFSTAPFSDILVFFFDNTSYGNQLVGSGRDLTLNRAMSVNGFLSSGQFFVNYVTSPGTTGNPILAGGTIGLATGSGPGRCHLVNPATPTSGCGTGTDFTFALTACPAGALSTAGAAPGGTGPTMAGD